MEKQNRSHEETARRRSQTPGMIFSGLCWVLLFLSAIIAFFNLQSFITNLFSGQFVLAQLIYLLIFGGLTFLCWRGKDKMRVEYDYTFTPVTGGQADLDVAKVLGNSRRKLMTSLPLKNVEAAGAVDAPSFNRYVSMQDVKKHNWFVNREAKLYFFYFTKNGVRHLIVLELKDEMIKCVVPYLGMGVWQGA